MLTTEDTICTIDFDRFHSVLDNVSLIHRHGKVIRVSGLTVESCGPQVGLGQLCYIKTKDNRKIFAEVAGFNNDNLILLPLEHIEGLTPGDIVTASPTPRHINLSDHVLGRVLNGLGQPIDFKGDLIGDFQKPLDENSPAPLSREKITQPLPVGIRAIDGMLTCGKGQRVGIFAGSGVGKSVLLGDIANSSDADVNVVALIGERGREVREFLEEDLGADGLQRSVVIVATSDAPAIQRIKAAFLAVAIAEYFRDKGKDVMFLMDSFTRFAQAQREIGLAAGEPPAAKGYCPSVFALMPRLIERLGCSDKGSITGMLTVLVENDDLTDPVADSARSLLDGHIVLSRKLADRGHFPAVDILASVSRLMPKITSAEHKMAAQKIRRAYATYLDAEDLINIGAFASGSNPQIDASIAIYGNICRFLTQPVRQKSQLSETVQQLTNISNTWDKFLVPEKNEKRKTK